MELQTKVILPSNGKLYKLKEVTIKPMTSQDFDIINDSTELDFIFKVIQNSIVEPKGLNILDLHPYDIDAILYALRNLSIGPTYMQNAICPFCKKQVQIEIDMDKFETLTLDNPQPTEIKMPNGDTIILKVLTERIQSDARESAGADMKRLSYYLTIERIDKIILKEPIQPHPNVVVEDYHTRVEIEEYIKSMSYKDRLYLQQATRPDAFGVDTTQTVTCPYENCGKEFNVIGAIDGVVAPEFFRPTLFKA